MLTAKSAQTGAEIISGVTLSEAHGLLIRMRRVTLILQNLVLKKRASIMLVNDWRENISILMPVLFRSNFHLFAFPGQEPGDLVKLAGQKCRKLTM